MRFSAQLCFLYMHSFSGMYGTPITARGWSASSMREDTGFFWAFIFLVFFHWCMFTAAGRWGISESVL